MSTDLPLIITVAEYTVLPFSNQGWIRPDSLLVMEHPETHSKFILKETMCFFSVFLQLLFFFL